MPGLTAVTLLAENTVPILDSLCRHLAQAAEVDVVADTRPVPSSGDALDRAAGADLVWGCGHLLAELIDSGRLDAEIVAAPVFAGEAGPVYHSVIVAADGSIGSLGAAAGGRLAINETASWSGHHALLVHLAESDTGIEMFADVVETGSHRSSIEAVHAGEAEVASIDHTVWDDLVATRGVAGGVRVIGRTRDWPAPPFAVRRALGRPTRDRMIAGLRDVRRGDVVGLSGIATARSADYAVMRAAKHPPGPGSS